MRIQRVTRSDKPARLHANSCFPEAPKPVAERRQVSVDEEESRRGGEHCHAQHESTSRGRQQRAEGGSSRSREIIEQPAMLPSSCLAGAKKRQQQDIEAAIDGWVEYERRRLTELVSMALTRSFKETVQARVATDHSFREALLREAIDTMLTGDIDTGKAILRDYIDATVGFEKLGAVTGTSPRG